MKKRKNDQPDLAPVVGLVGLAGLTVGVFLTGGEGATALTGGVIFLVSLPCLLYGLRRGLHGGNP